MAASVQFKLPPNAKIGATAFANSAGQQDVTVQIDGAVVARFSGKGTANTLLGSKVFNSGSGNATVTVTSNGKATQVVGAQVVLSDKLNFALVGSEDYTDADFNDGILVMNWPLG